MGVHDHQAESLAAGKSAAGRRVSMPWKLLLAIVGATFCAELSIMFLLPALHAMPRWVEAMADAGLLVAILFPVLYFTSFRPLTNRMRELALARASLQDGQRELENRVKARTADLERRSRELELLSTVGEQLHGCAGVQEAHAIVARAAPEVFPETSGILFRSVPPHGELEAAVSWGKFPPGAAHEVAPRDCHALRHGKLYFVADPRDELSCRQVPPPAPPCYVCVPLIAQGEVLGVLHLRPAHAEGERPDPRLAAMFADQLALALANLRLRETLHNQSLRDALTGLYNRRHLEDTLSRELRRAERAGSPIGVVMLDLDEFKRFNDLHGHDAGDALLRELGNFLKSNIRGGDVICRYGGEEFVLIVPGVPLAAVGERVEKLRNDVRKLSTTHRGGSGVEPVTISAGIAMYPEHGNEGDALLRAADRALYEAKRQGRDRAVVARREDIEPDRGKAS